jgi:hypothetical protein
MQFDLSRMCGGLEAIASSPSRKLCVRRLVKYSELDTACRVDSQLESCQLLLFTGREKNRSTLIFVISF